MAFDEKLHKERLVYQDRMMEKGYDYNQASFLASMLGKDMGYSTISNPEQYCTYHGLWGIIGLIEGLDFQSLEAVVEDLSKLAEVKRELLR